MNGLETLWVPTFPCVCVCLCHINKWEAAALACGSSPPAATLKNGATTVGAIVQQQSH